MSGSASDLLVGVPRHLAKEKRLSKGEEELLGVGGIVLQGVVPLRISPDADFEVRSKGGHVAHVGEPPHLLLRHGKREPPHEYPEPVLHLSELPTVRAVEPLFRPVVLPHGEAGIQSDEVKTEFVEKAFVAPEEEGRVARALRGEGDPLDIDHPMARARREWEERYHTIPLAVESEGDVADRLVRTPDLAVVDHTVLPEQEKDIAVVEPV